jgi:hypothetical protein
VLSQHTTPAGSSKADAANAFAVMPETVAPKPWRDAPARRIVIEYELPLSGYRVVITQRGDRHVLEVFDDSDVLVAVASNSALDTSVLRGAWRGTRNERPWALVVGRATDQPVAIVFRFGGLRSSRRRQDVVPLRSGDFWIVEAATAATHATVTIKGAAVDNVTLQRATVGPAEGEPRTETVLPAVVVSTKWQ